MDVDVAYVFEIGEGDLFDVGFGENVHNISPYDV
jgi:hypothetical protein